MQYRRARLAGISYFFTVVTYRRKSIFNEVTVEILRQAFHKVKKHHPFVIDAIVVLPNHIHCIWTLPSNDADFSNRWRLIKQYFTRKYCTYYAVEKEEKSRKIRRERCVWQRRFWEHVIRDEKDFEQHVDYIHYNPVKHGLVSAPKDWPYSSFHGHVQQKLYETNWGSGEINFNEKIGNE